MKRIILFCAAGMSTSLLVTRMRKAAEEQNFECYIEAFSISKTAEASKDADVILLGPQVRYELNNLRKRVSVPIDAIDMRAYGMIDGKAVLEQAKKMLGI